MTPEYPFDDLEHQWSYKDSLQQGRHRIEWFSSTKGNHYWELYDPETGRQRAHGWSLFPPQELFIVEQSKAMWESFATYVGEQVIKAARTDPAVKDLIRRLTIEPPGLPPDSLQ